MDLFSRVELALGEDAMARLRELRVIVFGLGGVGGWCAEALARTGVGALNLVDSDLVEESNLNRQVMATTRTVGRAKAEALAERIQDINPRALVEPRVERYGEKTASSFALERFDYVIDAIDSLYDKAALIRHALSVPSATLFSSMGAAMKLDSLKVRASAFRRVEGDALARALRRRFRETGGIPERDFTCVWSPERSLSPPASAGSRVFGSLAHMTAAFGFALAGLVVQDASRFADEHARA